jgi:hypothetical protein
MMDMESEGRNKFERAQRRVARIKGFYRHAVIFVVINGCLVILRDKIGVAIFGEIALDNPRIMSWVDWNLYVWLIILVVHAILVFKKTPYLVKDWEKRQIQKYMDEDRK